VNGRGEGHDGVKGAQRPDASGLVITGGYQQFATVTPAGTRHRLTMSCSIIIIIINSSDRFGQQYC